MTSNTTTPSAKPASSGATTLHTGTEQSLDAQHAKLGLIYSVYRMTLVLVLMFLHAATFKNPVVGAEYPKLYAATLLLYFIVSFVGFAILRVTKPKNDWQLFIGLIADVFALTLILYTNGGPSIQMSMLYLVAVAASFILLTQRKAVFITLLAAICVVYQQFFFALTKQTDIRGFSNVALLSLSFMGVALLSNLVSRRLRSVENIAVATVSELGRLHQLNQQIVEKMDNGVLLVDRNQKILLCNKSAQRTLGLKFTRPERHLDSIDESFASQINHAIVHDLHEVLFTPKYSHISEALSIGIQHLEDDVVLLIIERISRSQQQAQQMKLAALGRLTASIAHEIRNPIGAISQASQLLGEDPNDDNLPIYQIIHKQTQRVNQIIEDVLKLSRQSSGEQQVITLGEFLESFLAEHFADRLAQAQIKQNISAGLKLKFNKNQFEQVLINLIENAFIHGKTDTGHVQVSIIASLYDGRINLDIIDSGDGISTADQAQLFEPFFTTKNSGTGLGLYLSKAFCEANGASLTYLPNQAGACFRLSKSASN